MNGEVQVINNLDTPLEGAHAHLSIYNLDGAVKYQHDFDVTASAEPGDYAWICGVARGSFDCSLCEAGAA